ncbi:hypothetical protein HanRHA438_Chr13g0600631 [Helianthus annuus]|nr:hypothetical protein HanRHA438_Chr13g0600631 [Helianthus annuus]
MAYKVVIFIISLIFFHHLVWCSPTSISFPVKDRSQPRRLLMGSSMTSVSTDPLGARVNGPETMVEASLRKRPPSSSNPTQN